MIKVEGLTKRYARTVAVDNISFEVEKAGIVGFLGPNGAGKTTTMRVLTGFLPPSSGVGERGRIRCAGKSARSQKADRVSARIAAAVSGDGSAGISDICR